MKLSAIFLILAAIPVFYGLGQYIIQDWNATAKPTGLCIFKGPAIIGGFFASSSDGIPLRDIAVKVWRNSTYTQQIAVIAEGRTDRTGCFSFLEHEGYLDYATYSYNGTRYTDQLTVGTILRDNVP